MNKAIFFFSIIYITINADVPYIPYDESYLLGNIETLAAYDIYFQNINLDCFIWGGLALVYPLSIEVNKIIGYEYAVELRKYIFNKSNLNAFYSSLYFGNAFMEIPSYYRRQINYESVFGISYGIKFGYQYNLIKIFKKPMTFFVIDPYFSISMSQYLDESGYWNYISHPIFSFGIRLLINGRKIVNK